jgi:hypothetical protein
MSLAQKVDAERFIQELKTAPQGVVLVNQYHILTFHALSGTEIRVFEAPDPLDMVHEDFLEFLVQVYRCLSEPGIRDNISYLGKPF